ncbi:MAG TPA: IS21 family transposase [Bryobacteraceae bacterium]|nr:IS21 family transposase [Bryobacteraceae bacterium]
MRKLKEVLRLSSLGLKQQQIARSCRIAQSTVHGYLKAAAAAGVGWPLPADWDDRRLEAVIWGAARPTRTWRKREVPDFAAIRQQLQAHRHLTLELVWEEYREQHPDGYRYSRFCQLYREWEKRLDVVLRQDYRAGEKMFVDYAGDKIPIYDRRTGEVDFEAPLFVAVLGASNYTFVEASRSQELVCWINSHIRALEFFEGVPEIAVPDNTRTGVKHPCRYEPELNQTYRELAEHYAFAVIPARPYKPRDKAKAEAGVQIAQRWIIAALRHRTFFDLAELNEAIAELLDRLNARPFRKRPDASRASLFAQLDRPALKPLRSDRYVVAYWKLVRANIDYHVELEQHYYSVPYQLVGEQLDARYTAATVEIFHRGVRVASHARSYAPHKASTLAEHRPKSHQAHLEWTPSRLINWAAGVGPATADLVRGILEQKPHPEMGYRACLGILGLAKKYSTPRLEAASQRALLLRIYSYQSLKSILKRSLDQQPMLELDDHQASGPHHDNVRGPDYYSQPPDGFLQ